MIRSAALTLTAFLSAVLTGCDPGTEGRSSDSAASEPSQPVWEVVHSDSAHLIIALSIVDASTVWAVGSRGLVGRSLDSGDSWTFPTLPGGDSLGFRDVHAFSADDAFVLSIGAGAASRIYRTTDGGASWDLSFMNEDPDAFFDCFSFWDPDRGIAFSDSHDGKFTLIRTLDGGRTWPRLDPSTVPDARPGEGAFASSGACVVTRPGGLGWFVTGASGVDSRVIRTTDYGASWEDVITPIRSATETAGIFALSMRDDSMGVIVGGDLAPSDSVHITVAVTTDGGATWTAGSHHGLDGPAYGVTWVDDGSATGSIVAVGPSGSAVSVDGGRSWTRLDRGDFWTVNAGPTGSVWGGGRGHISRLVWASPPER